MLKLLGFDYVRCAIVNQYIWLYIFQIIKAKHQPINKKCISCNMK